MRPLLHPICTFSAIAALLCPSLIAAPSAGRLEDPVKVDAATDKIIRSSLAYPASKQQPTGAWVGDTSEEKRYPIAMTAYTLMAFQAAGHLPDEGEYGKEVDLAVRYMLGEVDEQGLIGQSESGQYMYSHGIATIALAELFGQTQTDVLRNKLEKMVKVILSSQNPEGGWRFRTNSLGMRCETEPLESKPSLRVVVTGDSHTEGVCSNFENLSNQLALRLRAAGIGDAEVLNSGGGGYDFYNYVGVVRARAELQPDLYVVIVFGGNDFQGSMGLQRFFHGRGEIKNQPWDSREMLAKHKNAKGVLAQELFQAFYFMNNPSEEEIALRTAISACMEMTRTAAEVGARVLFVYLPPSLAGQPELLADVRDATIADLGLPPDCIEISNRLADQWLEALRERELPVLDLRPAFAGAEEDLYWR